jgi:hypothetical protein
MQDTTNHERIPKKIQKGILPSKKVIYILYRYIPGYWHSKKNFFFCIMFSRICQTESFKVMNAQFTVSSLHVVF